jgi:hypothetical protein
MLDKIKKICQNREKLEKSKKIMSKKAFVDLGNLVTPSLLELYEELILDKSVFSDASEVEAGNSYSFDFKNLPMLSCKEIDWHRDWEAHTLLWVLQSHGHILQLENKISGKIISKTLKFGDLICFNLDLQHRLIISDSVSNPLFVTLTWDLDAFQLPNGYKIKKWEDIARILLKEKERSTGFKGVNGLVSHFAKIPSKSIVLTQWERLPNSETEVLRECNKPLKTPYIWAKLSPYYSRFRVLPYSQQDYLNWFKLPSPRQQNYDRCKKQIEKNLGLGKHLVVQ